MKKIIKNKKVLIFLFCVFLTSVVIFFGSNKFSKLKGSTGDIPVNSNFTDIAFYSCVVDSFNRENNTFYLNDYNLSDEQLASIKKVICNDGKDMLSNEGNEKYITGSEDVFYNTKYLNLINRQEDSDSPDYEISNLDGLEKLTGAEELIMITENKFANNYIIDLESNPNLKTLKLDSRNLTFQNATNLETLEIYEFSPTYINSKYVYNRINGIASMVNLKKLIVHNAGLTDRDSFDNLKNLEELILYKTNFYDEDEFKDFEKLKRLTLKHYKKLETESFQLTDLNISNHKYVSNLEYLSTTYLIDNTEGNYSPFENLKYFEGYIKNGNYETVFNIDYLMPNLEKFSLLSQPYEDADLSKVVPGLEKLSKLKYLKLDSSFTLDNLDKLETLEKLELTQNSQNVITSSNTIKYLYGTVNDYSKFPNLKYYVHSPYEYNNSFDENTNTNLSSSIEEIYNFTEECNKFFEEYKSYNNLKVLEGNLFNYYISSSLYAYNLFKIPNIEVLSISYINVVDKNSSICSEYNCEYVDFNNNRSLKYLEFDSGDKVINIDQLSLLETLIIEFSQDITFGEYNNLKKLEVRWKGTATQNLDLSKVKNVEYLSVWSYYEEYNPIKLINLDTLKNLKDVYFYYVELENLDFSNSKELEILQIGKVDIYGLDLSSNNNLRSLRLDRIYYKYDGESWPLYIKIGERVNVLPGVKLPSYIKIDVVDYDSNLTLENNNILVGKDEGISMVKFKVTNEKYPKYKNCLWNMAQVEEYGTFYISVVDFKLYSKKFVINNEENYIYVKNITDEKEIIQNINFLPYEQNLGLLHSFIYKNRFKTFILADDFKETDIIKVTSNKYKIKDNNITYYGEFNIDNIRVTNAEKEVYDDKLYIKYNNIIIDEFDLIKLNSLIGDINNDGEITISDMILQYKHIEYELDLLDDVFFRADIDSNKDVEKSDEQALYNMIKNN